MNWDPAQYLKYAGERLRPALDLMARIPMEAPGTVFDLGCGTGNVTKMLADYSARIAIAYPALPDGRVLFAFRRVFVVASRAMG